MAQSKIDRTTYSVSDFIAWQRAGTLVLNPEFQRRPVWKPGAKSFLIDTILRGYPIPVIFLRDLPADLATLESKREVVDGQQRIRTVLSFVASDLLSDYDSTHDDFKISRAHNKSLAGKRFTDLAATDRQRILGYRFGVHTFPSTTDDREILQIFARMNATGVRLNGQELRNADYYGEFKTTCYELASEQLQRWRDWGIFTAYNIARMDEVEFTSELCILIISGISEKTTSIINRYYKTYDAEFSEADEVGSRFRSVMDTIEDSFTPDGIELFRKRTLFYCLFAAIYDIQYGLESKLSHRRPSKLRQAAVDAIASAGRRIEGDQAPKEVLDATTRRTTHVRERRTVTQYLLKRL